MNRRSFLLTSIGGIVAAAVLPKLPEAEAAPVENPNPTYEVLRIDGKWVDVPFKLISSGDYFRLVGAVAVWRAVTNAQPPAVCKCENCTIQGPYVFGRHHRPWVVGHHFESDEIWSIEATAADMDFVRKMEDRQNAKMLNFPRFIGGCGSGHV